MADLMAKKQMPRQVIQDSRLKIQKILNLKFRIYDFSKIFTAKPIGERFFA